MRAKKIKPESFQDFYDIAPEEIKQYFDKAKTTLQSKRWHPETTVKNHIVIVFNRAKRSGDINMMLAALFHDLGKMTTTHFKEPDSWSSHGHEFASVKLVEKYRDWIEELGANYDIVHFIVKEHMRAKLINDMRPSKRNALMTHPFYPFVEKFAEFDNMKIDYSNDTDE